jgi:hypothetical protein
MGRVFPHYSLAALPGSGGGLGDQLQANGQAAGRRKRPLPEPSPQSQPMSAPSTLEKEAEGAECWQKAKPITVIMLCFFGEYLVP